MARQQRGWWGLKSTSGTKPKAHADVHACVRGHMPDAHKPPVRGELCCVHRLLSHVDDKCGDLFPPGSAEAVQPRVVPRLVSGVQVGVPALRTWARAALGCAPFIYQNIEVVICPAGGGGG